MGRHAERRVRATARATGVPDDCRRA